MKDALDEVYRTTLTKIERYLSRKLRPHYKFDEIRGVAIKFQHSIPGGGSLSVDLLLSPYFEEQEQFFRFLQTVQPPMERLRYKLIRINFIIEQIKHHNNAIPWYTGFQSLLLNGRQNLLKVSQ